MESSVFLSYSVQDRQVADRLVKELKEAGVRVWFDREQILPGDSVVDRINEGIREADYLVVLLSRNSVESQWVRHELRAAVTGPGGATDRVLPVRVDDAPIPPAVADVRWVDLRQRDYASVAEEIRRRIKRDAKSGQRLSEVVDTESLATELAESRSLPRGPEFYISTAIGVVTIIVAVVAAIPGFQQAFGEVPHVVYEQQTQRLTIPPGADRDAVLQILAREEIPPAGLRMVIENKGTSAAGIVRIGCAVEGQFMSFATDPILSDALVWVRQTSRTFQPGTSEGLLELRDFSPKRPIALEWGYSSPDNPPVCDVVAEGNFATLVRDVSAEPDWSPWNVLITPLKILGIGLLMAVLVGTLIASARNPRLRDKMVDLAEAILPPFGRVLRVLGL